MQRRRNIHGRSERQVSQPHYFFFNDEISFSNAVVVIFVGRIGRISIVELTNVVFKTRVQSAMRLLRLKDIWVGESHARRAQFSTQRIQLARAIQSVNGLEERRMRKFYSIRHIILLIPSYMQSCEIRLVSANSESFTFTALKTAISQSKSQGGLKNLEASFQLILQSMTRAILLTKSPMPVLRGLVE